MSEESFGDGRGHDDGYDLDDPAPVEAFCDALREALKDNPTGDFGAEAAVEAFNEQIALAEERGEKRGRKAERAEWCTMILQKLGEDFLDVPEKDENL